MQKNSNAAIFAIRPEYAKSILDGTKKYEYRKVACKKPIEKMLIYATAPIMQVVGEADIREVLVDDPEEIWNRTNEFSGITKDFFDTYTLIGIVDSGRCCENDLKILTDNIYEIELKKCNKNSENNKAETEEDQLNLIDPKKLIEYIENIGWIPFGIRRKNDTTLLYKRKNQPITKMDSLVTIPIDKDLWNYKQLLKVAVLQIARTENCTMMEVVKSIIKFRERSGNYGEIKQVRIL